MLVVMKPGTAQAVVLEMVGNLAAKGAEVMLVESERQSVLAVVGGAGKVVTGEVEECAQVERVVPARHPYKLASREARVDDTVVRVGGFAAGGGHKAVIAGPCSVESREQMIHTAELVKAAGATMLRGGAFKPRTSPYSFQGLGEEGLKMLAAARETTGLPFVTEVMDLETFDLVEDYTDMIQIGARNMQNFPLLRRAGRSHRPILLKRGLSATLEEFLMAAEYVLAGGNNQVILCERGIRTFETYTRNTLDISAIPAVKELSHLPIIVDPSHACGKWSMVEPLAKAAMAADADGLIIEVHHAPESALCDGAQSLRPDKFERLMQSVRRIVEAV